MKTDERLAALEALLARVQANAAAGRSEPAGAATARAAPSLPPTDVAPPAAPVAREAPSPEDLEGWSSLLERDLRDPTSDTILALREPAAPSSTEASDEVASDPSEPTRPGPLAIPSARAAGGATEARAQAGDAPPPPAAVSTRPPAAVDPAHGSELVRALQEVADHPPSVDPRALWDEAAHELRERRGAAAPTRSEPPGPPPRDATAMAGPPLTPADGPPLTPADEPEEPRAHLRPPPAPRRPRRSRRDAGRWSARPWMLSLFALAAGVTAWAIVGRPDPEGLVVAPPPATGGAPVERPPSAATSAPPLATLQPGPAPPPAGPSATSSPPVEAPAEAPPRGLRSPADQGWLRVEAGEPVEVYLQGVIAGPSRQWLEVPCGMKNARMARPGNPPPGHSFPMWLGPSRTIRVPCGGDVTLRWSLD